MQNLAAISNQQRSIGSHPAAVPEFLRPRRTQSTVVPDQLQRRHLDTARPCSLQSVGVTIGYLDLRAARGEMVGDHGGEWVRLIIDAGGTGFDAEGLAQFQRAENRVERVTTDDAECARPKIPPAAPFERQVN